MVHSRTTFEPQFFCESLYILHLQPFSLRVHPSLLHLFPLTCHMSCIHMNGQSWFQITSILTYTITGTRFLDFFVCYTAKSFCVVLNVSVEWSIVSCESLVSAIRWVDGDRSSASDWFVGSDDAVGHADGVDSTAVSCEWLIDRFVSHSILSVSVHLADVDDVVVVVVDLVVAAADVASTIESIKSTAASISSGCVDCCSTSPITSAPSTPLFTSIRFVSMIQWPLFPWHWFCVGCLSWWSLLGALASIGDWHCVNWSAHDSDRFVQFAKLSLYMFTKPVQLTVCVAVSTKLTQPFLPPPN